jgi:hypothetical protein
VIGSGGKLYELSHRRTSLEDLFVQAIEEEQRK